mgnify:CR=1 FL=1|jgi:hypothetical protein
MNLFELYNTHIVEAKMVWARKGKKVVRKFRCTSGIRAGRVVASPAQCTAPINIKQRMLLKKTKAQKGARMMRKSKKTKRMNPASKMVQRMNKT